MEILSWIFFECWRMMLVEGEGEVCYEFFKDGGLFVDWVVVDVFGGFLGECSSFREGCVCIYY